MSQATVVDGRRGYEQDGKRYDAVTTVIGYTVRQPWLEKWRGDVGNQQADRKRDEAAEHGTNVHAGTLLVAQGTTEIPFDLSELHQEQVDAFKRWFDVAVSEVIGVEQTVYNDSYGYAGTLDLIAILRGDKLPSIIDTKTGIVNAPYCKMQTAAYKNGDGIVADRRLIVDLKQISEVSGLPKIHEYKDHGKDYRAFADCLSLYRYLKEA